MKGISRRASAVVAAVGLAALAAAPAANAQRPASAGDGTPTGQGSVQMFNYGGFIGSGSGVTGGSTGGTKTAAQLGITIANAADGSSCATATSQECRNSRLDGLLQFLAAKGITNIELFGWSGFPANGDTAGLNTLRALMDKSNIHCAGWHGDMTESAWQARIAAAKILGCDSMGSGGFPNPGIGSYDNTLRTIEALNRLGKQAIEGGVGPTYFHNHQGEFRSRYVDNGVRKTAWQIVVDRMDTRYAFAEIDAGWSSDAYDDPTGTITAGLINANPTKVKMLHIKDVRNVAPATPPASGDPLDGTSNASPVAFGTGEIDYRPIFTAAKDRVEYYHQEQDGGSLNDADVSLTNLKGINTNVKGTVLGYPTTFPTVAAGTAASANAVGIKIQNTGDAPLTITAVGLATAREGERNADFSILSNTCVGTPVAAVVPPSAGNPGGTRSSCIVNVGFKPTASNTTSTARLQITSSADNGTEQILLVGKSTGDALGGIGGDVPSALALTLGGTASFGSFTPAFAKNYDTATSASVVSTAGDATLSVADNNSTAPGHLVNGTFALPAALQIAATNAANPTVTYKALPGTTALPTSLLTYAGPTAGADTVTLNFRQAIGATDTLRAGSYSKTLTFTLSTTTP
ncbi:TIM barrel protein [Solirubrobacter soli]|uniref:TIM barrel protein n=1 Tax=Solirubrobacter soli TaxID=363832 RepID=UPI0003FDC943|nr:TIM barrel protein [Solirubrobacter soli]